MASTTHPSKQLVRSWLARRSLDSRPPPSPEEIKRSLGWELLRRPASRS